MFDAVNQPTRFFVSALDVDECEARLKRKSGLLTAVTGLSRHGCTLILMGIPPIFARTVQVRFVSLPSGTVLVATDQDRRTTRLLRVGYMGMGAFLGLMVGTSWYAKGGREDSSAAVDRLVAFAAAASIGALALLLIQSVSIALTSAGDRTGRDLGRWIGASEVVNRSQVPAVALASDDRAAPTSWRDKPLQESIGAVATGSVGLVATAAIAWSDGPGLSDVGVIGPIVGVAWFGLVSSALVLSGLARFATPGNVRSRGMNRLAIALGAIAILLMFASFFELTLVETAWGK